VEELWTLVTKKWEILMKECVSSILGKKQQQKKRLSLSAKFSKTLESSKSDSGINSEVDFRFPPQNDLCSGFCLKVGFFSLG